ncbi:MAG: glycosyltransferase family 9 protein [Armatimonadota bacterium]|nr:glycosyltransferase family 9 protein [Armatimonadota bacterium]
MPNLPANFIKPLAPVNFPRNRCRASREDASKRILIMRLAAHGDILMGTPLLAALREAWPDAHITWIAGQDAHGAIEAHPNIDEILLWPTDYWTRRLRKGSALFYPMWAYQARALRRALKANAYDLFISLQPEEWPHFVGNVGANTSIGVFDTFRQFSQSNVTSANTGRYTHSFTAQDLSEHRLEQYLLPLKALGLPLPDDKRMTMGFTAEDVQAADDTLAYGLPRGQPFVTLAPMTTWPSRCWPGERYAALGDALMQAGHGVLVLGSARGGEPAAVTTIAERMQIRPIVATGSLSFRQMAAMIARSALLVSGDTGPMHVASAVGTPFLSLFGPTPIASRAPLAGRGLTLMHPVPCGPCDQKICPNAGEDHMRCMKLLTVAEVFEAACALLESRKETV